MKKELRDAWVTALRSGNYAQGRKRLRSNTREAFCCLGVLCEISPDIERVASGYTYQDESLFSSFSERTATSIGLTLSQQTTLVCMNDQEMRTFPEIANWIESNIPTEEETMPPETEKEKAYRLAAEAQKALQDMWSAQRVRDAAKDAKEAACDLYALRDSEYNNAIAVVVKAQEAAGNAWKEAGL